MDKFRKQPNRIYEPKFEWQACHKLMYPFCELSAESSDKEIAARFLEFSFDEFISVLPAVYRFDGHFSPQSWNRKILLGDQRLFNWPACKVIRIEDTDALADIPDIDWSIRTNPTGHIEQDFELKEEHKVVIRKLYKSDFILGGYSSLE